MKLKCWILRLFVKSNHKCRSKMCYLRFLWNFLKNNFFSNSVCNIRMQINKSATKPGSILYFFIKCPVQSQEYCSCYLIVRLWLWTAVFYCCLYLLNNLFLILGGLAVCVPGEIRGYWLAHQIGGRLPWKDLFQPSIKLCREGIVVGSPVAFAMSRQTETIEKFQGLKLV